MGRLKRCDPEQGHAFITSQPETFLTAGFGVRISVEPGERGAKICGIDWFTAERAEIAEVFLGVRSP